MVGNGTPIGNTRATQVGMNYDNAPNGRMGRIGDHRVEIGRGDNRPSGLSAAKESFVNFFKGVGASISSKLDTIKAAFSIAIDKVGKFFSNFEEKRTNLLNAMPPGMKVDDNGVISGTYTGTKYGIDEAKLKEKSGNTFEATMIDASVTELTPKTKMQKTPEGEKQVTLPQPEFAGIKISHQANCDFYRMDLTVHQEDGTFHTREDKEKVEATRTETVVTQLHTFTGDETAVSILSTVLNQNLSRPILDGLSDHQGNRSEYVIDQGKMGDAQFRNNDGELEPIRGSGIGALKLDLTKDSDGNYEVTGSWQMLFSQIGRGFDKSPIPSMDGAVIKGDSQMKFTIDAEQAKAGKLVFVHPPVVTVDFSGKMA